jgi:hypothetical protein
MHAGAIDHVNRTVAFLGDGRGRIMQWRMERCELYRMGAMQSVD